MPTAPALRKYSVTYPQCILDKHHAGEVLRQWQDAKAVVVAQEKHKDGATHLHAYIEFTTRNRRQTELFDIEGCHGNVQGCKNTKNWLEYITKEDDKPYTWGIDLQAMKRKQNSHLTVQAASEMSYDELRTKVRPDQLQKTLAGIQLDKLMRAKVQDLEKPCGIWLQGPPGVGKSHDIRIYCRLQQMPIYEKGHNKWWDGYSGEEVVLLDDIHEDQKSWITTFLKTWADAYAFKAETKGGMMNIRPKWVVVTSNFEPGDFAERDIDKAAIRRRFTYHYVEQFNQAFDALSATIGPVVIPPTPTDLQTGSVESSPLLPDEPSDLPMIDDPPGLTDLSD